MAELPSHIAELAARLEPFFRQTLHRLQTSIQALLDLGSLLVSRLGLPVPRTSADVLSHLEEAGHLPEGAAVRFRPIIGFGNRVVHLYDRIDERIVYRILTEERADIAELLELLLDILDRASDQR
jgi:uncharacterized protein YutE (UPF0331/DUF86 family)